MASTSGADNKSSLKFVKQLSLLQKIQNDKEILFVKICSTLTRTTKQEKWNEVKEYAVSIGIITNDNDFAHVRDTIWGNL